MRTTEGTSGFAATKAADRPDSEIGNGNANGKSADRSDSEISDWFPAMARELLPKDAGFALHILTGYEQRSCYRYARGERPAPADLLRNLMRDNGGERFTAFVLRDVPWWIELQRAAAVGRKVLEITK